MLITSKYLMLDIGNISIIFLFKQFGLVSFAKGRLEHMDITILQTKINKRSLHQSPVRLINILV